VVLFPGGANIGEVGKSQKLLIWCVVCFDLDAQAEFQISTKERNKEIKRNAADNYYLKHISCFSVKRPNITYIPKLELGTFI
jgi:hypothetical protein